MSYDRDFLILEHMSLAESIAIKEWRTATHALEKDEMISLANLGLVDAAERWEAYCIKNEYDPNAIQFFKIFARLRIRGTIRDHLRQVDWATRTLRTKAKKLKDAGADEGLSIAELAVKTDMTVNEIHKVNARLAAKPVSLDAQIKNNEMHESESHQLRDEVDTEGSAFADQMLNIFITTLNSMPHDVKLVIALHYYSKLDLRHIAEELSLPEAKVSQLHATGVIAVKEALTYAAEERG